MDKLNRPWIAALSLSLLIFLSVYSQPGSQGYTMGQVNALNDLVASLACDDWLCQLEKGNHHGSH